jgi:hypothetical protein
VQAWVVVHCEDPQRLESFRIPAHLIPINAPPAEDCTLEAMRTQAYANQCVDFKGLLFAQNSVKQPLCIDKASRMAVNKGDSHGIQNHLA